MKTLLVLLLFGLLSPVAPAAHADEHPIAFAVADCSCPPDCHCHKPGGSCPGKVCTKDCDCDKAEDFHGEKLFMHPSMREAISKNELRMAVDDESDFIVVDGVKRYTGFKPSWENYRDASTINIEVPDDYEMKEIDFSQVSYSPVRGQVQGSCWAEGGASAFELSWNSIVAGSKMVFSSQDIIDCSGLGTARSGGQSSLAYALDGLALNSDYPYTGRDGSCKKSVDRHNPLTQAPFVRGATGGFPTEREINYVLNTMGAMEICGCAGALGSGGWQEQARSCGTNHCYAHGGMRLGTNYGKSASWYHGMKNSWGDGVQSTLNPGGRNWGGFPNGWGWYKLAKEAGGKIYGSVITELQLADAGPRVPPEPVHLVLTSADVKSLEITIPVGVKYTVASVKIMLQAAID